MTKPLSTGEKTLRANIRAQKAIGASNAKLRAKATAERIAEHEARNEDRRILAIIDKRDRIAAGIAKRDAHNARLHADKVRVLAGQLLELADASTATSESAQSPVTANVYAIDARQKRELAASVLSTIGEHLPLAA